MVFFAKIKIVLKRWYNVLTDRNIIITFSFVCILFYTQIIRFELYNKQREIVRKDNIITMLNHDIQKRDSLIAVFEYKQKIKKEIIKELFTNNYYRTSLTGYHPVSEQTDDTPDITADGTKIDIQRAGDYRYVALSRDLLVHFNKRGADIRFGDYIMIKGTPSGKYDGIYQVRDTMNKRHTQWIDILLTPGQKSFYYKNVLMTKITNEKYIEVLNEIYGIHSFENYIASIDNS